MLRAACIYACLLLGGIAWAESAEPAETERIGRLIRDLDDRNYLVRAQAAQELSRFGAEALAPLAATLQDGSLEQRMRAIDIISRIYGRGDVDSFYTAEKILEQAASSDTGSLAASARTALETNYLMRQRLAVAEFERMGGRVLLVQSPVPFDPLDPEIADALEAVSRVDEVVTGVMIDRTWTGGDEGLKILRRLTRLTLLFLDPKAPLSEGALENLLAELPHVSQQARGPAYLGIVPAELRPFNGEEGCRIQEVTAGSSAARAGILPNDVVMEFDEQPVRGFQSLIELISDKVPGDNVPVTVLRNRELVELEVHLSGWPKMNRVR